MPEVEELRTVTWIVADPPTGIVPSSAATTTSVAASDDEFLTVTRKTCVGTIASEVLSKRFAMLRSGSGPPGFGSGQGLGRLPSSNGRTRPLQITSTNAQEPCFTSWVANS